MIYGTSNTIDVGRVMTVQIADIYSAIIIVRLLPRGKLFERPHLSSSCVSRGFRRS